MIRRILSALLAVTLASAAFAQDLPTVNIGGVSQRLPPGHTLGTRPSTTGSAAINIPAGDVPTSPSDGDCWVTSTGTFCRNGGVTRGPVSIKEPAAVNIYVDSVAGVNSPTCGTGTGALACQTLPQAARNLCVNYNHTAVPVIHGVAGQTYTAGLQFTGGFAGAASKPICDGIPTVIFDGHGSSIASADSGAIMLYYVPMTLYIKNVSISVTSVNGSPILVRGAGVVIIAEGVTIGQAASGWAQAWAYGGGQIATCPVSVCPANTVVNMTGTGGTSAFLATEAGGIQVEGTSLNISGSPAYTNGFANATGQGIIAFAATTISGAATGDQFIATLGGVVNTNAQTGGYSACQNTYLPGDKCGQVFAGGVISQPGAPTVTSGCGTGCIVQGSERAFRVVYGTGLGSTSGTTYGPARITFATRTNYSACAVQPSDPAIGTPWVLVAAPTTAPGYIDVYWRGNGTDPATRTIYVTCDPS